MKNILKIIFLVLLGFALFVLNGAICMWLWNWVIVELFGAKPISFNMAIGITLVLSFIGNFF